MAEPEWAKPEERGDVADYMARVFTKVRWGRDTWDMLLANRWGQDGDGYAVVVRDNGKIVGAIGQVVGRRPAGIVVCNLTSWYLDKEYRGQGLGLGMMAKAIRDTTAPVTNLSSARAAIPVALSSGMDILDDTRLIWHARPDSTEKLTVYQDTPAPDLAADTQQVIRDHAGLNLSYVSVRTPDGLCTMVLSVKQKSEDRIMHEVMYVDRRDLLSRHGTQIAASILPRAGTVLSLDQRFATKDAAPDTTEEIPVARMATPGRLAPELVDNLYSEIVLLDLKLY